MAHLHSVYDSDTHFSINPTTRIIQNAASKKYGIVQFDHNSERFTFDLPRYVEGHDMSLCNKVEVHYINIGANGEKNEGVYVVDDIQISPADENVVICSWLISANATKLAGTLSFLIRFACLTGEVIDYAWHTDTYTGFTISEGMNNGEAVMDIPVDVLEAWRKEILTGAEEAAERAEAAANRAEPAATRAEEAAERAENMIEGFVTPEMYGAKGDGVTDDTAAMQACINANRPILATKTYYITSQLTCNHSFILFGGGTFIGKSADEMYNMFTIGEKYGEYTEKAIVRDISFISTRDNENVHPPKGHTRQEGCLSSNCTFLQFYRVNDVFVENVNFESGEFDINCRECANVSVYNFRSNNASMFTYDELNKNLVFRDGEVKLYDLVGVGDHHFYICYGNENLTIENVKMFSNTNKSGAYPIHAWVSEDQVGLLKTLSVRNCYVEHSSFMSAFCTDRMVVENTEFAFMSNDVDNSAFFARNTVHEPSICKYIFRNCKFYTKFPENGTSIPTLNNANELLFENCTFDVRSDAKSHINISSTASCEFKNCTIMGGFVPSSACDVPLYFENCKLENEKSFCVITASQRTADIFFTNCELVTNSDGIASIRSASAIIFIGCRGTNAKSSKKFNYDGDVTTGTYKLYNCVFPDLTFRTGGASLVEKNTIWSTT